MSKRNFTVVADDLREVLELVREKFNNICDEDMRGGSFLEDCYNTLGKRPSLIIEKMFSENVNSRTREEFAKIATLCDLYRFKEVYHKMGRYGAKHFVTVIMNDIALR